MTLVVSLGPSRFRGGHARLTARPGHLLRRPSARPERRGRDGRRALTWTAYKSQHDTAPHCNRTRPVRPGARGLTPRFNHHNEGNEHRMMPGSRDLSGRDDDAYKPTRQRDHEWYGDHHELNWRDREIGQMYGMDSDTYASSFLND